MAEISRAHLFGKLNPLMFKSAESAVTLCKLRGNPHVELAHWLFQIVNLPDSDVHRIVRHFELDSGRLVSDFQATLERLPRGAAAIEDFSEHVPYMVKEGWMYGTLLFGDSQVRSGYLLVGLLKTDRLRDVLFRISREFQKIKVEALTDDFARILKGSPEDGLAASDGFTTGTPGEASNAIPPAAMGKQEALRRFASDLTARAKLGEIDPVTGRDEEIRQIVDILMRRRQNNPILTGEAGVGKTAVVEGFALRIAQGDVPPSLKDVQVWTEGQPGWAGHIFNSAIAAVAVEGRIERAFPGEAGKASRVDEEEVLPAIAVIVKESAAGAHGLGEVEPPARPARVPETDARRCSHVREADGRCCDRDRGQGARFPPGAARRQSQHCQRGEHAGDGQPGKHRSQEKGRRCREGPAHARRPSTVQHRRPKDLPGGHSGVWATIMRGRLSDQTQRSTVLPECRA